MLPQEDETNVGDEHLANPTEQVFGFAAENATSVDYLNDLLYPSSVHTTAEFLLDIMIFFKSSKISKNSLNKLLKLFVKYLPASSNAPNSKEAFLKIVDDVSPNIKTTIRYSCIDCKYDINNAQEEILFCPSCDSTNLAISLESDVLETIKHFFEHRNLSTLLEKNSSQVTKTGFVCDIRDSNCFKNVKKSSIYDINFVHNVDGFPLGNSSTVQVWPNFLSIVELDPNQKKNFLILTDIWIGAGKPDMNK